MLAILILSFDPQDPQLLDCLREEVMRHEHEDAKYLYERVEAKTCIF